MELKPFVAKLVKPGEPLTAQAWNDIVNAMAEVYAFVVSQLNAVRVKITNPGIDPSTVRVTATRPDGPPFEAIRPIPPSTDFILVEVEPGAYSLRVDALGFAPSLTPLTVTPGVATPPVSVTLAPAGAIMPDLFGVALPQALDVLSKKNITVSRVLDFLGTDLPPQNPGSQFSQVPVLVQSPMPGTPVTAGGAGAQLVVAVAPVLDTGIEVPSLAGMTQIEAQKLLEQLGLVLGKTEIKQK